MDKEPPEDAGLVGSPLWSESSLEVNGERASQSSTPPQKHFRQLPTLPKQQRLTVFVVILLMVLGLGGLFVLKRPSPANIQPDTVVINTQSLDNGTLNELSSSLDGAVKKQLTISSDTIFKNNVEVQGSAQISNDLAIGGKLIVQEPVTLNSTLAVSGSLVVNGAISASSLSVGSLAISSLNLSGDLVFAGHIVPIGSTPNVQSSVASSSGTVSISGNDTAGTITINVGGGLLRTGEMVIIRFTKPFTGTPKVQLTPINDRSSGLNYYATRSTAFFTINTSTLPSNNASYVYDYLVTQ